MTAVSSADAERFRTFAWIVSRVPIGWMGARGLPLVLALGPWRSEVGRAPGSMPRARVPSRWR